MRLLFALICLFVAVPALAEPASARELEVPGPRKLERAAREVLAARFAMSPDLAAGAGLFEEGAELPSFSPASVADLNTRLEASLEALGRMNTASWPLEAQIDHRWLYALALEGRRELVVERLYQRRPAEWLEPAANSYLALLTYAPQRADLRARLTAGLPAMLAEIPQVATQPTARDVTVALGLLDGLRAAIGADPPSADSAAALAALDAHQRWLEGLSNLPEYAVIGEANYAWRLKHVLLLPWTPAELLALAERELAAVDAELAALEPALEPLPGPDLADPAVAALDQSGLLALYDGLVERYLGRLRASDALTVPEAIGPLRARPTPEALIPLTGDGGSMNQAPTFGGDSTGWWNVEHTPADWPLEDRAETASRFRDADQIWMGTYAVHEGVPGHHLQLSVARLNPNPLRSVMLDTVMVEGWALYAERLFWEHGGFGESARAHANMLRSWRHRVRRVIYDVNVETGRWTLQQAADWKAGTEPGQSQPDPDLLRSLNWPTQLICYFAGRMQIMELRERQQTAQGAAWSSRAFHDVLLGTGSVPLVFAGARLLGDPLPPLTPRDQW